MKACEQWREEILDHALGRPAGAALAAHLHCCAACSGALAKWRERAGEMDAGIRRLAAAEPSPELEAQVLGRIHERSSATAWFSGWKVAGVLLACAAAIALFFYQSQLKIQREREQVLSAAAALSRWRSPTATLMNSPSQQWLWTAPRLGETFFDLKPGTRSSKQEKENP